MFRQLTANLWLLVLTLLLCAIAYPLALWAIGQTVFYEKANGSLLADREGRVIGSRLVAQPFMGDEYFHPRPSAVAYNAAATGGSNWGAANPKLRERVVALLGPMLKYNDGRPVGPDVTAWVRERLAADRAALNAWVAADPNLPARWAAAGANNAEFLAAWAQTHDAAIAAWRQEHPELTEPAPADLASLFFASYARGETPSWPESDGAHLQLAFFPAWWAAHPDASVAPAPAELVMASGCGLDPHITLAGAIYQLDRVAAAWAGELGRDVTDVRREIEQDLRERAGAPLGGLAGVELVNVLEINLALRERFGR